MKDSLLFNSFTEGSGKDVFVVEVQSLHTSFLKLNFNLLILVIQRQRICLVKVYT